MEGFSEPEKNASPKLFELKEVEDRNIGGLTLTLNSQKSVMIGNVLIHGFLPRNASEIGKGMTLNIKLARSRNNISQFASYDVLYQLIERGKDSGIYLRLTGVPHSSNLTVEAPEKFRISRVDFKKLK